MVGALTELQSSSSSAMSGPGGEGRFNPSTSTIISRRAAKN